MRGQFDGIVSFRTFVPKKASGGFPSDNAEKCPPARFQSHFTKFGCNFRKFEYSFRKYEYSFRKYEYKFAKYECKFTKFVKQLPVL